MLKRRVVAFETVSAMNTIRNCIMVVIVISLTEEVTRGGTAGATSGCLRDYRSEL